MCFGAVDSPVLPAKSTPGGAVGIRCGRGGLIERGERAGLLAVDGVPSGMLAYLSRVLPVYVRAQLARDGQRISRLSRRVWLSDIDMNLHMNQAVYAQVSELGRADWLLRSGAWKHWRSEGVNPVVAEQTLTYRRELKPLARYVVETRAVGVDRRLLRFESHMLVGTQVHTRCDVSLIFVGAGGVLSPDRVRELCQDYLVEPLAVENWRVV